VITIKVYGPPGTGKTTSVVRDLKSFSNLSEVVVVSLTRATKKAFLDSCQKLGIDFPRGNCRTMHSWCYRSVQEKQSDADSKLQIVEVNPAIFKVCMKDVFGAEVEDVEVEDLTNFLEEMQYSSEPAIALWQAMAKVKTTWDLTIPFYKHLEKFVLKEGRDFGVTEVSYFVRKLKEYEKWKKENDVLDFTDFLLQAVTGKVNPFESVSKKSMLIIDEIQDLYPLAFRVFQKYADQFSTVVVAGDDDQTIYSFAGANPELFLELPGSEVVLDQSYRLPQKIYEYALKIIRKNKLRKEKQFYPCPRKGIVDTIFYENLVEFLEGNKRDTLILARTNYVVQEYVQLLEENDVPYKPILSNVKVSEKVPRALQIHELLRTGKELPEDLKSSKYLEKLLDEVVYKYVRVRMGVKQLKKEQKEKIREAFLKRDPALAGKFSFTVRELLTKRLEDVAVKWDKKVILNWRRKLPKLEEWLNPKVKVGTIHSAKGLEAERVFVDPRITQRIEEEVRTTEGLEAERRVWYVACTRAKEELYVVDPPVRSFYRTILFPLPEVS